MNVAFSANNKHTSKFAIEKTKLLNIIKKTISKQQCKFQKVFRNNFLKLRNKSEKQKKNNVINDHFIIENARKRHDNDIK